jgi:WD40 repeat protein
MLKFYRYSLLLQKLSLNEKCVTKLVPARITSLAFHPFTASPVIAAGDKRGHLGIWQVGLGEEDGVFLFEPHIQPLTCLKYGVNQPELLFSTSYDSTVRCMDLNKEVFDEVFSLPEVEEVQFHGLAFVSNDSTSLLISCSDGTVHAVDTREARKRCPKYKLHTKSVKCIDIHPVNADYFVTSSSDSCVAVWDVRYLKSSSSHVARTNHFRQVDCAYFSSLTGNKILSTSTDNTIKISSFEDKKELKQLKSIRHDNQTGRWLTNFKAMWDPKRDDVFVVGSMKRPRQVSEFTYSTVFSCVIGLTDRLKFGDRMAAQWLFLLMSS